ncbi:NAD(P)H-quinone oxidoreductase subunit I, chloroplastic [Anaerotignum neopropionicum]|uniref:NAD(P)H-quinone oxidoreductase subunit I, chloroplastic n=1 Tax=Anaerotignum neopropionicum TaxID=36847 RepID=A0A136WIL9_9FIRM|nr:4Fe-4S binding protein [Anaerotignum neopropionicum]KXL54179.1 NAD(P)H-quinone oxidoreductase subunit I, chloroplastic [Anaerotignum neopropionicum]KXL54304.1 NAD(P)H-quinone oxidoreductase subunit I, chloroplastic [Anaerotignum neopropionicum]
MKKIVKIDINRCPQNHRCPSVRACPVGALTQKNIFSAPVVHEDNCIGCGRCAMVCPKKALFMTQEV